MGNWNINIQGIGPHHNLPNDIFDANNMAAEFVRLLSKAGHTVQAATFTHGGAESLFDSGLPSPLDQLAAEARSAAASLAHALYRSGNMPQDIISDTFITLIADHLRRYKGDR